MGVMRSVLIGRSLWSSCTRKSLKERWRHELKHLGGIQYLVFALLDSIHTLRYTVVSKIKTYHVWCLTPADGVRTPARSMSSRLSGGCRTDFIHEGMTLLNLFD